MIPEVSTAESKPIRLGRLGTLHATIALAFSILVGSITALQVGFGLGKFGGLEYVPRVTALTSVRGLGPACSTSAALYALLIWTHPVEPAAFRSNLLRAAPWVLPLAVVGAPLTTALTASSGFLTARWIFGVPWQAIAMSRGILTLGDILAAATTFLLNVVLVGAFCWFALPAMRRRCWSLVQKIGVTCGAVLLVRFVADFVAAASRLGG